jgi:NitT/TauT family transport system substrate-binding protein
MNKMSLRCSILVLLVTFFSLHLAIVPTAMAQTTVKLAAAQNSIGSLPIILADREGLFAAEKLKIEIVDFKGGAPAVQALASGSVDACICAADHAVRLQSRGQGGIVLVALTEFHGYGLVALANAPVNGLKDLAGKKVGITSAGSLTDNTLRFYLEQAGMNPDRDLEIVGTGTGGPTRAAIESGAIAAGMLTTPDVQAALANPKFKLIQDYRNLQYPALGLLVVQRWVQSHDETARALARAVVRAERLVRSDRPAVEAALAQMYPALDPKLRAVLADEAPRLLAADGRMAPEGYALMQRMLRSTEPSLPNVAYAKITAVDMLPPP